MFRRRRLPEHLVPRQAAFEAALRPLERAKGALLESVPGTRLPGRPLAETLLEFEHELREVDAAMEAWRAPEVEGAWTAAGRGLDEALTLAHRVRTETPQPDGFEALIGLIGDLLEPLRAFAAAAERFRDLRH